VTVCFISAKNTEDFTVSQNKYEPSICANATVMLHISEKYGGIFFETK
jgi:hypothetical protein